MNIKYILSFFVLITVLISIGTIVFFSATRSTNISPEQQFLQVGNETLYGSDFLFEKANTPHLVDMNVDQYIRKKMVRDSIILQEASKRGLLELDSRFYNNMNKDYNARIASLQNAESALMNSMGSIEGVIVALWFYNNDQTGPLGYEESKKITFEKLSALQNRVKNGQLPIDSAVQEIKNDVSLATIDPAYKSNAMLNFKAKAGQMVVYDPNFNQLLFNMAPGEITDVYTLKTQTGLNGTGPSMEALHAFAVLHKKEDSVIVGFSDIDSFYDSIKNTYEVK